MRCNTLLMRFLQLLSDKFCFLGTDADCLFTTIYSFCAKLRGCRWKPMFMVQTWQRCWFSQLYSWQEKWLCETSLNCFGFSKTLFELLKPKWWSKCKSDELNIKINISVVFLWITSHLDLNAVKPTEWTHIIKLLLMLPFRQPATCLCYLFFTIYIYIFFLS